MLILRLLENAAGDLSCIAEGSTPLQIHIRCVITVQAIQIPCICEMSFGMDDSSSFNAWWPGHELQVFGADWYGGSGKGGDVCPSG